MRKKREKEMKGLSVCEKQRGRWGNIMRKLGKMSGEEELGEEWKFQKFCGGNVRV